MPHTFAVNDRVKVLRADAALAVPQKLAGLVGYVHSTYPGLRVSFLGEGDYFIPEKDLEPYNPTFAVGQRVRVIRHTINVPNDYALGYEGVIRSLGINVARLDDALFSRVLLTHLLPLDEAPKPVPVAVIKHGYCATCAVKRAVFGVVCEGCFQRHREENRA